jgi:hypothetical protein
MLILISLFIFTPLLPRKGIISPKLQLLSGHSTEKSLAIYPHLALADVSPEYQEDVPFAELGLLLRPIAASLVLTPWRRFYRRIFPLNSVLGSSVRMEYAIVGLGSARSLDQG